MLAVFASAAFGPELAKALPAQVPHLAKTLSGPSSRIISKRRNP
jgi:hypothetical protein